MIDDRIVRVSIEVDGRVKIYEGLYVYISGMKYANPNQNECEVKIANLDKATRDYILTETSPFNKNRRRKKIIIEAGRVSYGTSQIFIGDIITATISQPPDLMVTLKALTGNYDKGNVIARSQPAQTSMSNIAKQVAGDLGLTLDFQATDKVISNYSFTGGSLKQVEKLGEMGAFNAYVDDDVLVVKDVNVPLTGQLRILNLDSGMIGIPEFTEQGVKVKFLLDNKTTLGSALQITSQINPAVNGFYSIYQLGFEIASRDTPFYWIASTKRID